MNLFIKKILIFCAFFLLLFTILEIVFTNNLKKSHSFSGEMDVWNYIFSSEEKSDLWIYGSSRAYVHFNTILLEDKLQISAYNFGINGNNFYGQYLRHIELIKKKKLPKNIILSLDTYSLQKSEGFYNDEQFLPYMLWNKNMHDYINRDINSTSLVYLIPFIRYIGENKARKEVINILKNGEQPPQRIKGFDGKDLLWDEKEFLKNQKKIDKHPVTIDYEKYNLLISFIKEMKEKGVNLIICYTPEYYEGQHWIANKNEILNLFANIAKKNQLVYLNYLDHSICKEKKYFYNVTHLNKTGANLFTEQLIQDLKQKKLLK